MTSSTAQFPKLINSFLLFMGVLMAAVVIVNKDDLKTRIQGSVSQENKISPKDLSKILAQEDVFLINVHTPYEGEIPQTDAFMEYDLLIANQGELPTDKQTPIVLYCKTGAMSAQALQTLESMGYTNVRHLEGVTDAWEKDKYALLDLSTLPQKVLPEEGITLPISWGELGVSLIKEGVIDLPKFKTVTKITPEQEKLLTEGSNEKITINSKNSHFIVNVLWALGLGQKSIVYEEGPLGKEYRGDRGNFASTGGWTLAKGNATEHLGMHNFMSLSGEQEQRVSDIAKNVYRPCCGNNTWFPDCNHGMAALAAIELMVQKNLPDEEIYKSVLALNSYWFPDSYLTTATYFARKGIEWEKVNFKEVLGAEYSSGNGAAEVAQKTGPLPFKSSTGTSCGA